MRLTDAITPVGLVAVLLGAAAAGFGESAAQAEECTGHMTVTVTRAAPRPALYDVVPMFRRPNRRWTPRHARRLLHIRRGPALIGVHIEHVRDLGTHSGVHFQAVPVADAVFGGPADCAPAYDPATAPPVPSVCLVWWPDRRTRSGRARDCLPWLAEGRALGTIPLSRGRILAYWMLPAGLQSPAVIPTGIEHRRGRRAIRFRRVAGQLHVAVTRRWPFQSFDTRWVDGGKVVRQRGPSRN